MMSEAPVTPNGDTPADPITTEALEQRVRRLEDVVAGIQDTRQLEERIVERVSDRMRREPKHAIKESAGLLVNTGRQLLPAALTLMRPEPGRTDQSAPSPRARASWVLFEAYHEIRDMLQMLVDRRYRMSWSARVVPSVLLVAILTSWIWLPGTSILPTLMTTPVIKVLDLVLGFLAYKILSREVLRYRTAVQGPATLPPA